jgi:3-phenylpropionate/cinnamic acid dioxygenase small subunit
VSANSEVAIILRASVEDFYYDEADMLDQFRLRDWLNLLTDEVRYRIPIRVNRLVRGSSVSDVSDNNMLLDEDKRGLTQRVVRLETGRAWAEEPRSRSRHLVTNVRVRPATRENEFIVTSNFIAYRNRLEVEQDFFVGTREDLLRLDGGFLKIASRLVLLDQAVLTAKNLTILF